MFDAVLFDLDETLILDEPVSRHAFRITALELTRDEPRAQALAEVVEREAKQLWLALPAIAADYATRIGHSALEGLWATYDVKIEAERVLETETRRIREEAWRRGLEACALSGDADQLQQRWQAVRSQFPLYEDCDEVLALLRPHTKLALVTNGVSGLQRKKVNGSGLAHWFDAVAISGEVGIGKPDAGIFDWVAKQLGVQVERCAMVGDNPDRDVLGGNNAGMKTAWLDRGLKQRTVTPTIEATSLRALLPWLRG